MLTEEAHDELRMLAIKRMLPCRVCSKCGAQTGTVKGQHPYGQDFMKAKDALDRNPSNYALQRKVHTIRSLMHWTSRCCGVRIVPATFDYHESLWDIWKRRHSILPVSIDALRVGLDEAGQGAHDDYVLMNAITNLSDYLVNSLIKIFRKEEERQNHPAESVPEIPLAV